MKCVPWRGAALAGAMLFSSVCLGQQEGTQSPHVIAIQGVGRDSCGAFLSAVEGSPSGKLLGFTHTDGRRYVSVSGVYAEWIEGYISGVNAIIDYDPFRTGTGQYEPSKQIALDYRSIELWIRQWCRDHTDDTLVYAVASFVESRWNPPAQH